jgi:hypothetical protein
MDGLAQNRLGILDGFNPNRPGFMDGLGQTVHDPKPSMILDGLPKTVQD